MLMMLVPLYALYEFAILAIRLTHWRASRRAASASIAGVEGAPNGLGMNVGPETPPGGGRVGGSGPS